MKREITHHREVKVRGPASPKSQENAFAAALEAMVELMATRFRNGVLKELNVSTVNKFADSIALDLVIQYADRKKKKPQVGNYANVFLDLANSVIRKMNKQFSDDRIEQMVAQFIQTTDDRNRKLLHDMIEQRIGIDSATLSADEGLTFTINALEAATAEQVKKLKDDTLNFFTANTLRDMTLGHSLGDLMSQFDDMVEKRKGQARMVARTQISNFNSLTTKIRAQNLGIQEAEWVTAQDDRVRPSHAQRNGKRFDLADGCYSSLDKKYLLPGVDYNCRCTYMLIIPEG